MKLPKAERMQRLVGLLCEAAGEPVGVLLKVEDVGKFRADMVQAKKFSGDSRAEMVQMREVNLPDGNVVLVKGERKARGSNGSRDVATVPGLRSGSAELTPELRELLGDDE